jgi:hypothetical protein
MKPLAWTGAIAAMVMEEKAPDPSICDIDITGLQRCECCSDSLTYQSCGIGQRSVSHVQQRTELAAMAFELA